MQTADFMAEPDYIYLIPRLVAWVCQEKCHDGSTVVSSRFLRAFILRLHWRGVHPCGLRAPVRSYSPPRRIGSCFCVFCLALMTIGFMCVTSDMSLIAYAQKG
jgi:hypothetical protein